MSNAQNETWLENALDNFKEAVAQGNLSQARAVIADVRDNGFESEANILEEDEALKVEDVKNDDIV